MRYLRESLRYRVLEYIEDFLIAPSPPGRKARAKECAREPLCLKKLFERLGVVRHPEKGEWEGSSRLDHLGVHIDTVAIQVYATEKKVRRARALAQKISVSVQRDRRLVPLQLLPHFFGVCASISLDVPLFWF